MCLNDTRLYYMAVMVPETSVAPPGSLAESAEVTPASTEVMLVEGSAAMPDWRLQLHADTHTPQSKDPTSVAPSSVFFGVVLMEGIMKGRKDPRCWGHPDSLGKKNSRHQRLDRKSRSVGSSDPPPASGASARYCNGRWGRLEVKKAEHGVGRGPSGRFPGLGPRSDVPRGKTESGSGGIKIIKIYIYIPGVTKGWCLVPK